MPQNRVICPQKPRFTTDFARYHVENPPLRPYLFKTVDCPVVDRDENPVLLRRRTGQRVQRQATMRYFWEVARVGSRWAFVEWAADGAMVDMRILPKRWQAIAMYERDPGTVRNLDLPDDGAR